MWKTVNIGTYIAISIGEILLAPAMLEIILETAFIILSAFAFMDPFALYDSVLPLAHVAIAFWGDPHAHSMLLSIQPLARVELSLGPSEFTLPTLFVIEKLS